MDSRSHGRWAWLGIGGLVVLNVVLIALLLLRPTVPSSSTAERPAAPPASPSAEPIEDERDDEEPEKATSAMPTPTETAAERLEAAPAERIMVAASEWVAWRATVGECGAPGELEHTVDGGETWQELPNDLAPLSRIRVLGTSTLFAIGGGADCEPQYMSSSTAGTSWTSSNEFLSGSWYLDPADRSRMGSPVGIIDTPCAPVDLAGADALHAGVLCTDGTLTVTDDGGASWQDTSPAIGALAVGVADGGYVLAGTDDSCDDGVAVSVTDLTGTESDEPACAEVDIDAATELAVTVAGGAVWLWAGDEVTVSDTGRNG